MLHAMIGQMFEPVNEELKLRITKPMLFKITKNIIRNYMMMMKRKLLRKRLRKLKIRCIGKIAVVFRRVKARIIAQKVIANIKRWKAKKVISNSLYKAVSQANEKRLVTKKNKEIERLSKIQNNS